MITRLVVFALMFRLRFNHTCRSEFEGTVRFADSGNSSECNRLVCANLRSRTWVLHI